jgi:hypothetical protein
MLFLPPKGEEKELLIWKPSDVYFSS